MSNVIHLFTGRTMQPHEFERPEPYQAPKPQGKSRKPRKPRERIGGLSYYPRLKVWKGSNGNVQLNPETLESTSYRWWRVTLKFGNTLIFNNYRYSNMTSKHQWAIRSWLFHHGYEFETLEAPRGLTDLDSAESHYRGMIERLEAEIAKPRTRKAKNQERREEITGHKAKLALIRKLKRTKAWRTA